MPSLRETLISKYKYKARFEAAAHAVVVEEAKLKTALASLDKLAGVFDPTIAEKIKTNPDLVFISSNLIHANYANLNDDCVMLEDLLPVHKLFVDKYLDIEHEKSDVVGCITNVGFSHLDTDDKIELSDLALADQTKIQLVIGGFLWYLVNKDLCSFVEESSAAKNGEVSTSFELLFNSYWIGIGANGSDNALEARLVVPQDKEFKKYDAILRCNGGTGMEGNSKVFRILKTDILPIGAGIVANPASGIKGILAVTDPAQIESQYELAVDEDISPVQTEDTYAEIVVQVKNNIILDETSVSNTSTISQNNIQIPIIMEKVELKSIEDITAKWAELSKNEASASAITEFITKQFAEPARKFSEEQKAKEAAEAGRIAADQKITLLEQSIADLQKTLSEVRAEQESAKEQEAFQLRMESVDNEFELDDEDRAILADEIKEIESTDEAFAAWMTKKKKLLKEKTKAHIAAAKTADLLKLEAAKANVTPVIDTAKVVAAIVEQPNQSISNAPVVSESLKDKLYGAFSKNVTVGGKKVVKPVKK